MENQDQVRDIVTSPDAKPAASVSSGAAAAGTPPARAKDTKDTKALEDRLAKMEGQLSAANEAAIHWHGQYQDAVERPAAKTVAEPAEEDEDDLVETLATGGIKALVVKLKKHFVTSDDFETRANGKIASVQSEGRLRERYPDLEDRESEFFQATAEQYRHMDSIPKGDRLELAAERAELALRRTGKWKDRDPERAARAGAQDGGNGHASADHSDEQDLALTPYQKELCEKLGVTEEAYTKRAKAGVRFAAGKR